MPRYRLQAYMIVYLHSAIYCRANICVPSYRARLTSLTRERGWSGGGTAIVYEALDQQSRRKVALKVLNTVDGAPVMPTAAIQREVRSLVRIWYTKTRSMRCCLLVQCNVSL